MQKCIIIIIIIIDYSLSKPLFDCVTICSTDPYNDIMLWSLKVPEFPKSWTYVTF